MDDGTLTRAVEVTLGDAGDMLEMLSLLEAQAVRDEHAQALDALGITLDELHTLADCVEVLEHKMRVETAELEARLDLS